jgi:hypothetical protein
MAEAQTKNESGAIVAGLLLGELGRLASGELPEAELTPRKAVLIGGFARNLETASGLVSQVANLALYGLSFDEINSYINNVAYPSTAKDVQSVLRHAPRLARRQRLHRRLDAQNVFFPNSEAVPKTSSFIPSRISTSTSRSCAGEVESLSERRCGQRVANATGNVPRAGVSYSDAIPGLQTLFTAWRSRHKPVREDFKKSSG